MTELMKTAVLFRSPEKTRAWTYLSGFDYPWQALAGLKGFIAELGPSLPASEFEEIAETVWVARDAAIDPTAYLGPLTVIGHGTEVRHGAYVRGAALVGDGCVVGNSTELKNCILFDDVHAPHYNYVGDSILGCRAHLGAGAVTSNLKSDGTPVRIRWDGGMLETGIRKVGAMLGDRVEVGCNSVLNPGTVIGEDSRVYPLSSVRGFVPPRTIFKSQNEQTMIQP